MSIAFFDAFGGASGNMILGALVDAGLSVDALERELRRLPVRGWKIKTEAVHKRGIGALYLDVDVPGEDIEYGRIDSTAPKVENAHHHEGHPHRSLADVLEIIRAARYPAQVESKAIAIYERLAAAEARVHRMPVDEIAFHEVGQVDAIVDVAGAVLGLHLLGIDAVYCSPLPCGRGTVHGAHGAMPSPSPATLDLLRGVPTYAVDLDAEMVTPTGAAILTGLASFALRPPMTIDHIGYGAGRSEFPFANVLRVSIGERAGSENPLLQADEGDVVQIETNIDDMNPQLYAHVAERLVAAGALDVWTQAAQMKKGRPGTLLAALAPAQRSESVAAALLAETTTIGVRRWPVTRVTLPRSSESVTTSLGLVRVKVVATPSGRRARPEYDDCAAIARRSGMALGDVMRTIETEVDEWLKLQA
ncbi:MAG TPA: nickel pincer cofactor biosynthesis protein LarC [Candidatus Eremiobacteraceae bacterium]|nr:nickel pincer cofactor biosynthesis protein LarC [Candidatus Eremiobacteraceae bacterium]